jgi:hypothetical protein
LAAARPSRTPDDTAEFRLKARRVVLNWYS